MTCCNTFRYSFQITRSDAELAQNRTVAQTALAEHKAKEPICENEPEYIYWTQIEGNTFHLHYGPANQAK